MQSRQVLILVTGSVPGVGKSSLALALAQALEAGGRKSDLFHEEEIRTHSAFRRVMHEFESTGEARLETLLTAAAAYLDSVREQAVDALVLDALLPYLPSLLAWGYSDEAIGEFFAGLAGLSVGFEVVELHLVGDPDHAIARAVEREGGDWLDGHVAKASGFRSARPISTADDLVAYYNCAAGRSQVLLADAPWRVELIDADRGAANAFAKANACITSLLQDQ